SADEMNKMVAWAPMYETTVRSSLVSLLVLSCGGENTPVATPAPEPATTATPGAEAAPLPPHPSGKRPPCKLGEDQACNDDPKVSALWGRCTEAGTCECNDGFQLTPWGRCAPAK